MTDHPTPPARGDALEELAARVRGLAARGPSTLALVEVAALDAIAAQLDALSAAPAQQAGEEGQQSRHQPCGCVYCVCEDEDRCHGCGATNCGKPDCQVAARNGALPDPTPAEAAALLGRVLEGLDDEAVLRVSNAECHASDAEPIGESAYRAGYAAVLSAIAAEAGR